MVASTTGWLVDTSVVADIASRHDRKATNVAAGGADVAAVEKTELLASGCGSCSDSGHLTRQWQRCLLSSSGPPRTSGSAAAAAMRQPVFHWCRAAMDPGGMFVLDFFFAW
ncbi:unnamed protein product [Miscanthus lutarioriparius]|uniref:Uncharacterized protein n=1 Tax=Miscanthus lutarioriparius TaxID=422564 RepID=A0A811QG30_9POAL|nr:unnamed protein product [Miscanthus lutarioriparius]